MVLLQISSIILAIGTSIVLFVQSVSLSTCRKMACCDTTCWFDRPLTEATRDGAGVNSPTPLHSRPTLVVKDL